MMDEIIDNAEMKFDAQQTGTQFPQLVHFTNTRKLLKDISGKRVSSATIEIMNLIYQSLCEDIAQACIQKTTKQISVKDIVEVLRLRRSVHVNLGSLTITRINQRADTRLVRELFKQERKRIFAALKHANISEKDVAGVMDEYDLFDEDDGEFAVEYDEGEEDPNDE